MYDNHPKLLGLINRLFRKDLITEELCRTIGGQLDSLEENVDDLHNQLFLDTATWALDILEGELGIDTVKAKPLADRRAAISAKWRGTGKLTLDLIKKAVDAYIDGDADVRFTGRIEVDFTYPEDIRPNITDIYNTIWHIKPAHLPFVLKVRHVLPETNVYVSAYMSGVIYKRTLDWDLYYTGKAETHIKINGQMGAVHRTVLDSGLFFNCGTETGVSVSPRVAGVYRKTILN